MHWSEDSNCYRELKLAFGSLLTQDHPKSGTLRQRDCRTNSVEPEHVHFVKEDLTAYGSEALETFGRHFLTMISTEQVTA